MIARRRPAPLLQASIVLHLAVAAACLVFSLLWPLFLLLGNHLLLAALTLWPGNPFFGPNLRRLPELSREVVLTFDDGPDPEVTPKVLELLAAAGAHASFFCIGERVRHHPELARRIVAAGHTLENHTQSHLKRFALLAPGRMRDEIAGAQMTMATVSGREPRFFRPVAGFASPLLAAILAGFGLELATWTRRGFDTRNGDAEGVSRRLLDRLAPGDILLLHDGNAARSASGQAVVLEVLPLVLAELARRGWRGVSLAEARSPAQGRNGSAVSAAAAGSTTPAC